MYRRVVSLSMAFAILIIGGITGCRPTGKPTGPPATTVVPVSYLVKRDVREFVEYTGRTDAIETVGIKARVTGYLTRIPFTEGAEVKKGDLLFEIDPRPYKAQLDQAEGQVRVSEAQAVLARANYMRMKGQTTGSTAFSQQEIDQAKAAMDAAEAQVTASKATAEVYRLNLEYTKVTSPIDGQIGRTYYSVGNLISQDQTQLTTVVSTDPMYCYFDMDERTVLRIRNAINSGKIKLRGSGNELPVFMGLEGEDGFSHSGTIDFVNNVVNPSTGTIAIRGKFENPQPPNGRRLLSPGMFARIRFPIGQARPSLLVTDRAIGSDQGLKYVYVIDAEKKVRYRRVKTGSLEDDGLRVIEEGLKPDEMIAIGAIQQLRPEMDVDPEVRSMPLSSSPPQSAVTATMNTPPTKP